MRRFEQNEESELESPKEVDTARAADAKIHVQLSRADQLPSVEPTFDELRDFDQECEELEHSFTKLQEVLEAASTNRPEWQSQNIQTRTLVARRVSRVQITWSTC